MRLTSEELEKVKNKYGVDKLYSWSKINCFMTSPYEYYLKYVVHKHEDCANSAYAPMGGIAHEIIENLYNHKIEYGDMPEAFYDGWVTAIDIADLKFDRNDETKNNSIKNKYYENLLHFFSNHTMIKNKIALEKFMAVKIGNYVLQGYIDAIYKDDDGNYNIIDWKTSTKYSGKTAEEKCGQLIVYAIGLHQQGVPWEKIRICWNFLKYVTITYKQKNGTVKDRDIERCKIGEGLQANAKIWLKEYGYSDEMDDILKALLDSNSLDALPEEVRKQYTMSDCYVYIPVTDKLVNTWTTDIINAIKDIELREADYEETKNDKMFWDNEESVKSESYYFATLCGYSANLHLPYKAYLEKLEAASNGQDTFSGVGADVNTTNNDIHHTNTGEVDLSWLDNI